MSRQKLNYTNELRVRRSIKEDDESDPDDQTDEDIIRCVCDDSSDDGFTIQCETCEDWQHASCVNIKKSKIPEHYICDRCSRKFSKRPLGESSRRRNSLEPDTKKDKKPKPLKNINKRIYTQESDENDELIQPVPKKISRKKFTSLSRSVFREKLVEDLLIEVHRQWMESNKSTGKNKLKTEPSSTITPNATTTKRLDSIVVMESNLLLPAIPKASVRPLRKSLRGSFLQNQKDPTIGKGVFADIHIPKQRYLMEVTGELVKKSEYKNETSNHFSELGTPLAHVFFYRALDICIDARYAGNDARYIRRSCNPNSEIKSIILPNDSDDQTVHMGIYTSDEVDRGEEITIGWNWQKGSLMWHKCKEFLRNDRSLTVEPSEKKQLKKTLKLITTEFGDCACEDKDECLIEYLKDELTSDDDQDDQDVYSKKKRSTKESIKKPLPSATKKSLSRSIFSSDEEELVIKYQTTEKPRKLKQLHEKKRVTVVVPSSPATSLTDSVDIDIISTSPIPSRPSSESDIREEPKVGTKRSRPLPLNQLPCKKRWLHTFLAEQQASSTTIPISNTNAISNKSVQEIDLKYDESELSDGASSASTLPLEDTPTVIQNNTNQSMDTQLKQQELEIIPKTDLQSAQDSTENNNLTNHLSQVKHSPSPDIPATDKLITATIQKTVEIPRKKLSVREYLSIHRGHLPTPDERS